MNLRPALTCLLAVLVASACTSVPAPAERKTSAEETAIAAGMTPATIRTDRFDLYALIRHDASSALLVVYIEGDGFAWERRDKRSDDPTPLNPVSLHLAVADNAPAVAYLARPCQFVATPRYCDSDLWTTARYSEAVIAATDEALDQLKAKTGATKLALVGYSGGGTVAALAAARRSDVVWLKTVASPLDIAAFTNHHQVSPLAGSLNPASDVAALTRLPQIHYMGEDDEIVPPEINRAAIAQLDAEGCAELRVLRDVEHGDGWRSAWPSLADETPACR